MPWLDAEKDMEWRFWLDSMGYKQVSSDRGHYFNRTDMAMEAALAGIGIALARSALVADAFQRGALVSPFKAIDAKAGYYLLQAKYADKNSAVACFKQWLHEQCQLRTSSKI